jgi:hypothetical protein
MKRLIICALVLFTMLSSACTPDFSKRRYKRNFNWGHQWKRKGVIVFKTQTYRDPRTKTEARQEMLKPKKISFDSW